MPMTVHMYHPLRQPELPNHCIPVNGECSHFCVPAPRITENSAKTACVCPMDLELDADHKTCVRTTIEGKVWSSKHDNLMTTKHVIEYNL